MRDTKRAFITWSPPTAWEWDKKKPCAYSAVLLRVTPSLEHLRRCMLRGNDKKYIIPGLQADTSMLPRWSGTALRPRAPAQPPRAQGWDQARGSLLCWAHRPRCWSLSRLAELVLMRRRTFAQSDTLLALVSAQSAQARRWVCGSVARRPRELYALKAAPDANKHWHARYSR